MPKYETSPLTPRQLRAATRAIWSNEEVQKAHQLDPEFSDKYDTERTTDKFVGGDTTFQFLVINKRTQTCLLPPQAVLSASRRPRGWKPGY